LVALAVAAAAAAAASALQRTRLDRKDIADYLL
jgi:hypothetical protein